MKNPLFFICLSCFSLFIMAQDNKTKTVNYSKETVRTEKIVQKETKTNRSFKKDTIKTNSTSIKALKPKKDFLEERNR